MDSNLWTYEKLERSLSDNIITVDIVINVLKYMEIVKLVTLKGKLPICKYPLISKILLCEKLWTAKIKYIEQKVGFNLLNYVKMKNYTHSEFIATLSHNIVLFNKAMHLNNYDHNYINKDVYIRDIISSMIYRVSENGVLGLILTLGYGDSYDSPLTYYMFNKYYKKYYTMNYRMNYIYRRGIWKNNFEHMQFDHNLILNFLDMSNLDIDLYHYIILFTCFSEKSLIPMIKHKKSSHIYKYFIKRINNVIPTIKNDKHKNILIDNLKIAYNSLDKETQLSVKNKYPTYLN
jgi:hypothetical protein